VRQSFKKKRDVEAEQGKGVSLIAENRYLDVKKDYTTTVKELLEKYEDNFHHQAYFSGWKAVCLRRAGIEDVRFHDLRGIPSPAMPSYGERA
jgi:hypothetical protein